MKKILKLNQEDNGLKLIQMDEGFVVVSIKGKIIEENEFFVLNNEIFQNCSRLTDELCKSPQDKIIFATSNLNLEGVPVFEEKRTFLQKMYDWMYKNPNEFTYSTIKQINIFLEEEQAQQNLFTEEQIRDLYLGTLQNVGTCIKQSDMPTWEQVLSSIKQPKVEITFSEDEPIKCVML